MPLPLIFAPAGVGALTVSKKKKAKQVQAASNKWSTQFPLVDDYASMQSMIDKANLQLKTLNAQEPKKTLSGHAKWKTQRNELSKWIGVMKSHLRDLKSGMDMASTNVATAPTPTTIAEAPLPIPATAEQPIGKGTTFPPSDSQGLTQGEVEQTAQNGGNIASGTKRGTNWLLIGGVVVGAIVLYKMFKK